MRIDERNTSKSYLAQALFKLLLKRSFKKITVNDICQQAGISRSTFYLHFEDKYQLLLYCLQQKRLQQQENFTHKSMDEIFLSFYTSVKENEAFFYNLFIADMSAEIADYFQQLFTHFLTSHIKEHHFLDLDYPCDPEMFAVYYSSGFSSTTIWWIKNQYPISCEEMAKNQIIMMKRLLNQV